MLQPGGRHQGDIAKRRAAEVRQNCPVGLFVEPLRFALEMRQLGVGDRAEFLQVVLDVQVIVVDRLLAHDGVEVEASPGHSPAGWGRAIVLGVLQDVPVRLRLGVEAAGDEQRGAVVKRPGLPVAGMVAEECPGGLERHDIRAKPVE